MLLTNKIIEYKELLENALECINEEIKYQGSKKDSLVFNYKDCELLFSINSITPMGVQQVKQFQLSIKKEDEMCGPYKFLNYGDLIESVTLFMEVYYGKQSVIRI